VRSISTTFSRPALRAASGRPPARLPHDGHRGAGLSCTTIDKRQQGHRLAPLDPMPGFH
jgi:hypothetical protein